MEILRRDTLNQGGFAGVREHRMVKAPFAFGPTANNDGSWPGLGNFVYLADARFAPHGETHMHSHHEVDVISVMVEGRIAHQGSLGHGQDLNTHDVQVQRAGGEGFSHNEINPDTAWNRMVQLWVLPETSGQAADYKVYQPEDGTLSRIYGGSTTADTFPAKTQISVAVLRAGEQLSLDSTYLAYLTKGTATANGEIVQDGDLLRGDYLQIEAQDTVQLIVIQATTA